MCENAMCNIQLGYSSDKSVLEKNTTLYLNFVFGGGGGLIVWGVGRDPMVPPSIGYFVSLVLSFYVRMLNS